MFDDKCDTKSLYMYEGLPLNTSVITFNRDICLDQFPPMEYKTILDIVYMVGTFLGAETFHVIGETYGLRISLGLAIFTTYLGSSLGMATSRAWSVSFSSGELSSQYLYLISQDLFGYKIHHGVWRLSLLLDGLASSGGYSEEGRCQWMRICHLLHRCGQLPLNCFCPGRSQQ